MNLQGLKDKLGDLEVKAIHDMLLMQQQASLFVDGKRTGRNSSWGRKNFLDCLEDRMMVLEKEREEAMINYLQDENSTLD